MVQITHCGENAERLNLILEVAQKRFGMYGLGKTTMKEIADDLNLSKGSLYYYFSDKEHLYQAVVVKEHQAFLHILELKMSQTSSPEEMLLIFHETRLEYFRKLLNLSRFKFEEFKAMKSILMESWHEMHVTEVSVLKQIIQTGIDAQLFFCTDANQTAELLLDLLKGLRHSFVRNKEMFYLEQPEYDTLKSKTTAFIEIFINGLKYKK